MNQENGWGQFIENCLAMKDKAQLAKFFELTLTGAERDKIAARYLILAELVNGSSTHRDIATKLHVSIFNVTRGANQLKLVKPAEKKLIKLIP